MTDVVGVLVAADEQEIVVRRRDGRAQHVARADIVAMKPVPPPPPPRAPRRRA
jgi:hypothetical protein